MDQDWRPNHPKHHAGPPYKNRATGTLRKQPGGGFQIQVADGMRINLHSLWNLPEKSGRTSFWSLMLSGMSRNLPWIQYHPISRQSERRESFKPTLVGMCYRNWVGCKCPSLFRLRATNMGLCWTSGHVFITKKKPIVHVKNARYVCWRAG